MSYCISLEKVDALLVARSIVPIHLLTILGVLGCVAMCVCVEREKSLQRMPAAATLTRN